MKKNKTKSRYRKHCALVIKLNFVYIPRVTFHIVHGLYGSISIYLIIYYLHSLQNKTQTQKQMVFNQKGLQSNCEKLKHFLVFLRKIGKMIRNFFYNSINFEPKCLPKKPRRSREQKKTLENQGKPNSSLPNCLNLPGLFVKLMIRSKDRQEQKSTQRPSPRNFDCKHCSASISCLGGHFVHFGAILFSVCWFFSVFFFHKLFWIFWYLLTSAA